jgi:hypothetical protein
MRAEKATPAAGTEDATMPAAPAMEGEEAVRDNGRPTAAVHTKENHNTAEIDANKTRSSVDFEKTMGNRT